MKRSERGFFYGSTSELIRLDGVTLTDTEYQKDQVDWHFHEDDYFTFLLTGDLLFHNWQDAHYNILNKIRVDRESLKPAWVGRIREMFRDDNRDWSLVAIARELNIHPVHLSREFPKHFHTNLGDYLRMIRVQRAITLLPDASRSLTDIAFECGFADQSHFIRSFREHCDVTPLVYRRLLRAR